MPCLLQNDFQKLVSTKYPDAPERSVMCTVHGEKDMIADVDANLFKIITDEERIIHLDSNKINKRHNLISCQAHEAWGRWLPSIRVKNVTHLPNSNNSAFNFVNYTAT